MPEPFHLDLSAGERPGADSNGVGFDMANLDLKDYAVAIGLGVVAVLLLIFGGVTSDTTAVIFGLLLGGAAVVAAVNKFTAAAKVASTPLLTIPLPESDRQQILQTHLSQLLASGRGRIESVTPYAATVVTGEKVNHVLHLLISLLLCGFWVPVWILLAATGGEKRRVLTVDPCGNVKKS
jgi:hypothetical protein